MSVDRDPRLFDEPAPVVVNGQTTTTGTVTAIRGDLAPAPPRVQRRVEWLDLDADGYPGFRLQVWLNPSHLQKRLAESDNRDVALMQLIVLAHNGWCDEEGEPYPPASDAGFWEAIPAELGQAAVAAIGRRFGTVPNSVGARSGS